MASIVKTDAYIVNLSDCKGNRLMSADDVNQLIDNELGAVMDAMHLGHMGSKERLELHSKIRSQLPALAKVYQLLQTFEDARDSE